MGRGPSSLDFNPDGDLLASAGRDGHVTVWSVRNWKHVGDLQHHRAAVRTARFSHRKTLLTVSEDSTLILWNARETTCDACNASELVSFAKARVDREDSFLRESSEGYEHEHFRAEPELSAAAP